ncbi:MAG: sulfotransferase [Acidimicrobiia bacterium]|nr:sulfotransferase [Acidimicrobiia bacterium]
MSDDSQQYFSVIGGQKCGTSWLADYLFAHPQVHHNLIKEMHFFDTWFAPDETLDAAARSEAHVAKLTERVNSLRARAEEYRSRGTAKGDLRAAEMAAKARAVAVHAGGRREQLAMTSASNIDEGLKLYEHYFSRRNTKGRWFGDCTPAYALLPPDGWRAMLSVYPEARLIFIMRDPVDRLWSAVRHHARSFPGVDPVKELWRIIRDDQPVGRSHYPRTFASLDEVVPSQQVLYLFYEELFDPEDTVALRSVTDFLEIEPMHTDRSRRVNAGDGLTLSEEQAVATAKWIRPVYDAVEQRMGHIPPRWHTQRALAD